MANLTQGRQAEAQAADFLKTKGFEVLAQNWKIPICEIDIVAKKDKRIYIVEVKYRANFEQGHGLDYITKHKLKQMQFAAEVWVKNQNWNGDYSLGAVEVSGPDFLVTSFLPDLV